MYYTIKQVANMLDLTEHTIRYYTNMELFPCARDGANRRIFDDEALNWLTGIKCLRACGMSVEAIKEYCDLCLEGDRTIEARYEIILKQKALAQTRLKEAQDVVEYIEHKAEHYKGIMARQIPDDTNPATWETGPAPEKTQAS